MKLKKIKKNKKIIRSKSHFKYNKNKLEYIDIENFNPNIEKNFYYYFKDIDIYARFILKIKKNYYYYYCSKKIKIVKVQ